MCLGNPAQSWNIWHLATFAGGKKPQVAGVHNVYTIMHHITIIQTTDKQIWHNVGIFPLWKLE